MEHKRIISVNVIISRRVKIKKWIASDLSIPGKRLKVRLAHSTSTPIRQPPPAQIFVKNYTLILILILILILTLILILILILIYGWRRKFQDLASGSTGFRGSGS